MSRNSDNLTKSLNKLKQITQQFNKVSNNRYEEVSQEFNKVSINGYVCDICSEQSINDSLKKIDNKFGNIEVLVNSAAINWDKLLISASSGLINDIIDTNLKGTIFMCKAILKQMIRQTKGSIVNIGLTLNWIKLRLRLLLIEWMIGSVIALNGNIGQTIYSASKAGLIGFTKSLAKEVAPKEITVNLIAPGIRPYFTCN